MSKVDGKLNDTFEVEVVEDMVEVQRHLIDHFGIERLRTVIGGSLGGHQALAWAVRHPDRVSHLILQGGYVKGRNLRISEARAK